MIKFVYGAKGSGKTKRMIEMANADSTAEKGSILFINDRDKYRATVSTSIRFVDTEDFRIKGTNELVGFVSGLIAGNYDVDTIYIDNTFRIIEANTPDDIEELLTRLEELEKINEIKFVLSLSCTEADAPECTKKFQ